MPYWSGNSAAAAEAVAHVVEKVAEGSASRGNTGRGSDTSRSSRSSSKGRGRSSRTSTSTSI